MAMSASFPHPFSPLAAPPNVSAVPQKSAYPMVPMPDALEIIRRAAELVRALNLGAGAPIMLSLASADAVGSVLAKAVVAPRDVPARPCSRLDGYAVRAADGAGVYTVVESRRAGHAGKASGAELPRRRTTGAVEGDGDRARVGGGGGGGEGEGEGEEGERFAAYITTGSPLPPGADAIVKVEDTEPVADDDGGGGGGGDGGGPARTMTGRSRVRVRVRCAVPVGEGVRGPGSDARAGALLLPAGHCLTPLDVGALLAARVARVQVHRPLVVGILSTGDELADAADAADAAAKRAARAGGADGDGDGDGDGEVKEEDDVVVDSNRPMLAALLHSMAAGGGGGGGGGVRVVVRDLGCVRDDLASTTEAFARAAAGSEKGFGGGGDGGPRCDVVISTGAVSMGDRDFVKPALEGLARGGLGFGRLSMKPGKPASLAVVHREDARAALLRLSLSPSLSPAAAGAAAEASATPPSPSPQEGACLVLALPGNPVSAAVCFHVLARPALCHMAGREWASCLAPTVTVELAVEGGQGLAPAGLALDPERPEYHRAVVWWEPPSPDSAAAAAAIAHGGGVQQTWAGGPGAVADPSRSVVTVAPPGSASAAAGAGFPGRLCAASTGPQASSRMASTTRANALLWLPAAHGRLGRGVRVPAILLSPPYAADAVPLRMRHGVAGSQHEHSAPDGGADDGNEGGGDGAGECGCGRSHSNYAAAAPPAPAPAHPPHVIHGSGIAAASRPALGVTGGGTGGGGAKRVRVRLGVVTVSDTIASAAAVAGAASAAAASGGGHWKPGDLSGPAVLDALRARVPALEIVSVECLVVPDDKEAIQSALRYLAGTGDQGAGAAVAFAGVSGGGGGGGGGAAAPARPTATTTRCDLVISTGGTGLGVRDTTPEATLGVVDRRCGGLVHAMLAFGLTRTPLAALSRYEAGIMLWRGSSGGGGDGGERAEAGAVVGGGGTLVINMPGSPKAVKECVEALEKVLPHAVALATGQ